MTPFSRRAARLQGGRTPLGGMGDVAGGGFGGVWRGFGRGFGGRFGASSAGGPAGFGGVRRLQKVAGLSGSLDLSEPKGGHEQDCAIGGEEDCGHRSVSEVLPPGRV